MGWGSEGPELTMFPLLGDGPPAPSSGFLWAAQPLSLANSSGRSARWLSHASCEDFGCAPLLGLCFGLLQRSRVVGGLGVVLDDQLQGPGLVLARLALVGAGWAGRACPCGLGRRLGRSGG